MARFVIQSHVRLQEWVAEEHGYFTEQGLDYEFEPSFTSRSQTTSSIRSADTSAQEARSGTYEDLEQGRTCDVSSACHWTAITAESPSGKMWAAATLWRPRESSCSQARRTSGRNTWPAFRSASAYHSGSHYSALRGLEPFLARAAINVSFPGQLNDRVRLMLQGEIPAANVFGAQFYLLAQLGFHKLVDTTFIVGFLLAKPTAVEDAERYFRALQKAQRDIDLEPERYKQHWLHELPGDLATITDVRRYGPGERIVFEPYTATMFGTTRRWMKSWGLLEEGAGTGAAAYATAVVT